MEEYKVEIIKTVVAISVFLVAKFITTGIVRKFGTRFHYQPGRIVITNKILGVLLSVILIVVFLVIWGVDRSQLFLFLSTILTILGVAFFAQWSIISNITSTLIIFFSHPIRIGDSLTILDKEYQIEGELVDVGIFFLIIRTKENKEVTMPSNVFMQKMIKKESNN